SQDVEEFLLKYCHKPGGITFSYRLLEMPVKESYTIDEIVTIEEDHRSVFNEGETLGLYVFLAGGYYNQGSDTLKTVGIAYYNTSIVLFQPTIRENSGSPGKPSERAFTSTVLKHEL